MKIIKSETYKKSYWSLDEKKTTCKKCDKELTEREEAISGQSGLCENCYALYGGVK